MQDAFSMMDQMDLGWTSAPLILDFLMDNGVHAHRDDVYNFTRRFDRDNDSKLLFEDFCDAFIPKDEVHVHILNSRKPKYVHDNSIPKQNYFSDQSR